jgi:hypothetical protein
LLSGEASTALRVTRWSKGMGHHLKLGIASPELGAGRIAERLRTTVKAKAGVGEVVSVALPRAEV